jgi:type IV secretory pathway VirB10-like protein
MDWIFDNFQIVVLIALAVGSVVKQMADAAKARKEQREQQPETEWQETETTWTSVPIPPEYQPPPLPPPPARHFGTYLPPPPPPPPVAVVQDSGDFLRKQMEMQEKARAIRENKATEKTRMLELRARSATRAKTEYSAEITIRNLLANPASARKAIVLREILDKPLGLR